MTEAPGLSPEEVESLITFPIETSLNGANGVEAVRSSSGVGISVIYVEFGFNTNIYNDRQVVTERLQLLQGRLPDGVTPQLAPISSIMGQILMLGMFSQDDKTEPLELRTLADWVVRQRLLTIPGVAQVFTMGGGRKQFQILVDPEKLLRFGVSLQQVKDAVVESNENATGGYLDQQGPNELLVRALGRVQSVEDIEQIVVTIREGRPVTLAQIAKVAAGAQTKRGDSAAYERTKIVDGTDTWQGGPCVVLTINKQPGADTRAVTDNVFKAIEELSASLPQDINVIPLYSQKSFIDRAIENVIVAHSVTA
jgi:Cu/Ag efflux pump CusA